MFRKSHSVHSFSLIEMLVVLVLSSIIVSIIYFAYYTVTKYQMNFNSNLNKLNDVNDLYFLLKRDFDKSKSIIAIDDTQLKCHIERRGVDVQYFFETEYSIRIQNERIDTFKCQSDVPVFLWQGEKLKENERRVDELQLDVISMPEPVHFVIHKVYDASSLVETIKTDTTRERN